MGGSAQWSAFINDIVNFGGKSFLTNLSIFQGNASIGMGGNPLIMGDHDNTISFFVYLVKKPHYLFS